MSSKVAVAIAQAMAQLHQHTLVNRPSYTLDLLLKRSQFETFNFDF